MSYPSKLDFSRPVNQDVLFDAQAGLKKTYRTDDRIFTLFACVKIYLTQWEIICCLCSAASTATPRFRSRLSR